MLYIVATPIGNLEDITLHAVRVLGEVDWVLAEDTRKTGLLLAHYRIKKPLVSFYEHNEVKKTPWVIEELKKGMAMALVSSAGTPTISDPGYKLVRACADEQLTVTALPGPSSIMNALALSVVPHDKFIFVGYLPRKRGERERLLTKIKAWDVTCIFLESPFRIRQTLVDIQTLVGARRVSLCREMTKKFEEVRTLPVDEAIAHVAAGTPKGEFTVVLERATPDARGLKRREAT
ncbi:MAG: 16S rRNA (cytidine(1402)-2'-O)-methyltransferase [Candidatus Omnitrophota bacterium]|nr:16S rRNA (cytidine(1402)-2'-O)-methyltransferase [Candidatus Omnitrophota bacterium]